MKTRWLSGIKDEGDKRLLESEIRNSRALFRRMKVLLEQDIKSCRANELSKESYSTYSGSWSEFKADCTGYQRALTEVLDLIDLEE